MEDRGPGPSTRAKCPLVAERELCRGEELATLARKSLRAGLFPLVLGQGLRIQALFT